MSNYKRLDIRCACGRLGAARSDGLCGRCRFRASQYGKKYTWTEELDRMLREAYAGFAHHKPLLKGALDKIQKRTGFTRPSIHYRATLLGLRFDTRRAWTPWERQELENMAGHYAAASIAQKLHRSVNSVIAMMEYLKLRRRVTEGYSRGDLAACLGVSPTRIQRWERQRLLLPDPVTDRFAENKVRLFALRNPHEYSLKRVDESWFKGLMFPAWGEVPKTKIA